DADLDRALRIEQPVLDSAAERRAVRKFRTEEFVPRVGVRIDMDHADRPVLRDRLEDRIGDRMIAARGQRCRAGRMNALIKTLDVENGLLELEYVRELHVAYVGDLAERVRIDLCHVMDRAAQARHVADL